MGLNILVLEGRVVRRNVGFYFVGYRELVKVVEEGSDFVIVVIVVICFLVVSEEEGWGRGCEGSG